MTISSLVLAAQKARHNAVAPSSGYHVGAALQTIDGKIITGSNVESIISGMGSCAERSAIITALSQGHRQFTAIAVATEDGGTCCGMCRQFIMEFCGDIPIHITDAKNNVQTFTTKELLPHAFTLDLKSLQKS